MPTLTKRLTDTLAAALPVPPSSYVLHWCPRTPGFGVRVAATGSRSWIFERRVDGQTKRRTLGQVDGRNGITAEAARELAGLTSDSLALGVDPVELKREGRAAELADREALSLTFGRSLAAYVEGKRRAKDGLPLKPRTKADYLAMIAEPAIGKRGFKVRAGELYPLAEVALHLITGDRIREVHAELLAERGQRRADYAMQVLRAVLNWEGVQVENSPLAKTTAGRERIMIKPSAGNPLAIPRAQLGAWWRAAGNTGFGPENIGGSRIAGDAARILLLTGCRPGEIMETEHEPGLTVGRVNLDQAEIIIPDPKNRKTHTVKLSTQALEIMRPYCKGKKPNALVFPVKDIQKTMTAINEAAGVTKNITPHKLRHTFTSIAGACLPFPVVKALVNHSSGGDVTLENYFDPDTDIMRAAWQTVATFITELAEGKPTLGDTVQALRLVRG
jgi:integrase